MADKGKFIVSVEPFPPGTVPTNSAPFQLNGWVQYEEGDNDVEGASLTSLTIQILPDGPQRSLTADPDWTASVTPPAGATSVRVKISAGGHVLIQPPRQARRTVTVAGHLDYTVPLAEPLPPVITFSAPLSPINASTLPTQQTFSGTASSAQSRIWKVQFSVDGSNEVPVANTTFTVANATNWNVSLPVPPGLHSLTIQATDVHGSVGVATSPLLTVNPVPPIVVPPNTPTTFGGVPTTASITSWTRLEPQANAADMDLSASARVFDPLWMLTRQWQMGEFQGEDAGSPVFARVRATNAKLTRCTIGPIPTGAVTAPPYDPMRTPLEVIVERRRMRAKDANDPRLLRFAVDAGLHFLRMLELAGLSKSYRRPFIAKLAFAAPGAASGVVVDAAASRYVQSIAGRAPDGRTLATLLRTAGAAALIADPSLDIVTADRASATAVATAWLAWYDSLCSEPAGANDDAWNAARLEYSMAVGTRLSTNAADELTLSATEIDGSPLDWSNFDIETTAKLGASADSAFTALVQTTIPAPVSLAGLPLPRFWEMEDARVAYGLVPVGTTDLASLMMTHYAGSYGNDWFIVPLTVPVGSVTRVDSLVVTDTFGVRNLVRPIGDATLPPAYFSMWQPSLARPVAAGAPTSATNRFFLPPTLARTLDSAPLEEVLFMRDEMANVAWAVERRVESATEQSAERSQTRDTSAPSATAAAQLPRYVLSSPVPSNWIPLLPVQRASTTTRDPTPSLLRRGAVLQPDGSNRVHSAEGDVLNATTSLVLYDEEVPREGVLLTRQRRLARWSDGSTWLWTSFRNQVGCGEGTSALQFDQLIEPDERA